MPRFKVNAAIVTGVASCLLMGGGTLALHVGTATR